MHDHLSSTLTEKIEVLTLDGDAGSGSCGWVVSGVRWASVEIDMQRNLFSAVGAGTRGVTVVIRPDPRLTLRNAIRWRGEFLHLTSITPSNGRDRQEIKAAICYPVTLTAKPQDRTGRDALNRPTAEPQPEISFPGILTELYHRNDADDIYRSETLRRVLVTPKVISLRTGDLVRHGGEPTYTVRQVMDLDPWKNEYIIERQEDV